MRVNIAQRSVAELKAEKLTAVRAEKIRVRDGGFYVGDTLFDSDGAARTAYLELAMRFQLNPDFSTQWKASEGVWVEMTAELYAQVDAAGESHIGSVFAWQAAKEAEIVKATTAAGVRAISVVFEVPAG